MNYIKTSKKKLLIIGASGHGKVAADIAIKMNKWQRIVFLDDNRCIKSCMEHEVIGTSSNAVSYINEADIFVAIGDNAIREGLLEKLEAEGATVATLIHPSVIIGNDVKVEAGTAVMAGVVINCSTRIGKGCIINTGATLDHDTVIEDYVHISPGAKLAGTVKVGKSTWIGIGSVVSNNVIVCSGCKVGAGAVVINDITEPGTYVGIPAVKVRGG